MGLRYISSSDFLCTNLIPFVRLIIIIGMNFRCNSTVCAVVLFHVVFELRAGISSFVCWHVFDIDKCLWWLADQDYTNERLEEVNGPLYNKAEDRLNGTQNCGFFKGKKREREMSEELIQLSCIEIVCITSMTVSLEALIWTIWSLK